MDNNYEKFVKDLYRDREQWAAVGTTKENPKFSEHFGKWNYFDTKYIVNKPGKVFLFEKYESGCISYPKIGIYLNSIPCDQTVEIEWYEVRRTWEYVFGIPFQIGRHSESTTSGLGGSTGALKSRGI